MTNADKFKHLFGIYATELWAMPENDFLEWLNADAQDMPTEPERWISCSERLPEPEMKVLVTLIDHRRQKINMNWNGEKRYSIRIDKIVKYAPECKPFWAKGNTPSVIAWMPLPEPYRENKSERD